MPPQFLFDISNLDIDTVLFDQAAVREVVPQRHEFEMLEGVTHVNPAGHETIGIKDIRDDEFWVRGHIPGRPLFPGVLQIELAAQLASFYTTRFLGWGGFIGFGGVEDVRFRGQVVPGDRLHMLCKQIWARHKRVCCKSQGLVRGNLVFEATIIGAQL